MANPSRGRMDHFIDPQEIGSGAYGTVFKAVDTLTNTLIAMKRMRINPDSCGAPVHILREVSLLKKLKSECIIDLKDVVLAPPHWCYLIFEYLDFDLRKFFLHKKECVTQDFICETMFQILKGLEYCHARRVMHRDLKPENILIDSAFKIKIADFGLARVFQIPVRPLTAEVQTLHYRAPEILLGLQEYTPSVDIWSAGCILAEMFAGKALFQGVNELHQFHEIVKVLGPPSDALQGLPVSVSSVLHTQLNAPRAPLRSLLPTASAEAMDLVEKMLVYDPCQRIAAGAALRHPYFSRFQGIN